MSSTSIAFTGGKLNLKGDKKKKPKKKSKKSKHEKEGKKKDRLIVEDEDNDMTEAERRSLKFKSERQLKELEEVAKYSHRERIEVFSEKLSKLTELNDIPRVSAAGNG